MPDRETIVETSVAVVAVLSFIAIMVVFGSSGQNNELARVDAFGLVGSIVFFIAVMALAGYWLANRRA